MTRSEDCACGGIIVCDDGRRVPTAVAVHQRSLLHQEWRYREGIASPVILVPRGPWPTADPSARDVSEPDDGASASDPEGYLQ